MIWEGISSELLMCGGGVHSILLLPPVARCLEAIDVYIWHMFGFYVCCSDCVRVCGNVCCVAAVVKDIVFLAFMNVWLYVFLGCTPAS